MGSVDAAGAGDNETMKVTVTKREPVAPVLPAQEHWLPLSNLDLLLPPVDVSVFFCYTMTVRSPEPAPGSSALAALKVSLAQVLVLYYPFAGEMVVNSAGEPELLCNNSGVDFVEAVANIELRHLDLYNPDESIEGKLVPAKKRSVLAVQATEFKCGGMVVACTFDHRIADAYSANMFLASWAEMCRRHSVSVNPSFCRSLLHPHHSGHHLDLTSIDNMYVSFSKLPPPPPPESPTANEDRLISRIYYIPANEIQKLQQLAGFGSCKRSKLEAFSSFLWKLVAESTSSRLATGNVTTSRMGIVVDGRSRLPGDMSFYFGNVLSIPFGENTVADLTERPLSWIADGVHEFLQSATTKEHFLGLIDWVEAHRPQPSLARIYCKGTEDGAPAFVVSSGLRFPAAAVDFGWGPPVFGSYHFPWGGDAGYVMPMPSPLGNGDWIVYVHVLETQLDFIELEAAHVFRPLTFHYLGL